MIHFDFQQKTIFLTVAYLGPQGAGKKSNLQAIRDVCPENQRGPYVNNGCHGIQLRSFYYYPEELQDLYGMKILLQLVTAPNGDSNPKANQFLVNIADGIVFVADSHPQRFFENLQSWIELRHGLLNNRIDEQFPLVFQWNKRDLPIVIPVPQFNGFFNDFFDYPNFEAVASEGEGVFPTLMKITETIIEQKVNPYLSEPLSPSKSVPFWSDRRQQNTPAVARQRYELATYKTDDRLLQALEDPCPWTRRWAALSIGRNPSLLEGALPSLIHALHCDTKWIREAAAQSLGFAKKQSQVVGPALLGSLTDSSEVVAQTALRALARLRAQGVPYLIKGLAPHHSRTVRIQAAKLLGKLGLEANESQGALSRTARESPDLELSKACQEAFEATRWTYRRALGETLQQFFPGFSKPRKTAVRVNLLI